MSSEESGFITVSSGNGNLVKGAWTELIASTSFACTWMVMMTINELTGQNLFFDLAIGGVGSEVIILDDQYYNWRNHSGGAGKGNSFSFPMTVPLGSRISVRLADNDIVRAALFTLTITDQSPPTTEASSTSDSSGVVLVTTGGLDAYGAWVELIAATTEQREWMVVSMFNHRAPRQQELDIGIGASGFEVPIMNDLPLYKTGPDQDGVTYSMYHYFPMSIPIGTRIAARAKDDNAGSLPITVGCFVT